MCSGSIKVPSSRAVSRACLIAFRTTTGTRACFSLVKGIGFAALSRKKKNRDRVYGPSVQSRAEGRRLLFPPSKSSANPLSSR